jgi:ABC-type antimicrobial peptide transport system permease subunit
VYRPLSYAFIGNSGNLVIRSAGSPVRLIESVRKAILEEDPSQPVANVRTMEQVIERSLAPRRFIMLLLGGFAVAALLLAAIGLYGVLSYATLQRTREIGIRIALGATRSAVVALILRQGVRLALAGTLIGATGSLVLTRFLAGQLYEIKPTDPVTFISVSLFLLVVAIGACWLPARRASRTEPCEALRSE